MKALKAEIRGRFGDSACNIEGVPSRTTTGEFEVLVDGKLVHSKLGGQGHIKTEEQLEDILDHIESVIDPSAKDESK